jgi:hypothetical protein
MILRERNIPIGTFHDIRPTLYGLRVKLHWYSDGNLISLQWILWDCGEWLLVLSYLLLLNIALLII